MSLENYKDKTKRYEYLKEHRKNNYKSYVFRFNLEKDKDIINALDNANNKVELIRALFRK